MAPVLAALVCSGLLFHSINPHQEFEGRYITMAIAPLLGLLPLSIAAAGKRVSASGLTIYAVVAGAWLSWAATPSALIDRQPLGFSEVTRFLESCDDLAGRRILIVSDTNGEGAFISEVATRHLTPATTVVRGTKLLARIDWPANNEEVLFPSSAAVMNELESLHIDYVVFDRSPESAVFAYMAQVKEMVERNPDRLNGIYTTRRSATSERSIVVYELTHLAPGPTKPLRIDLRASLGRVLEE